MVVASMTGPLALLGMVWGSGAVRGGGDFGGCGLGFAAPGHGVGCGHTGTRDGGGCAERRAGREVSGGAL